LYLGGSHFLRSLLHTQDSQICVVSQKEKINKEDVHGRCGNKTLWTACMDDAFDQVIEKYRPHSKDSKPAQAIGFTLHHHQIWCQTLGIMKFDACISELAYYCKERSIKIIHLVRETVLMMVSSVYLSKLLPKHTSSTTNATVAQKEHEFAKKNLMPLSEQVKRDILRIEQEFDTVHRQVSKIMNTNISSNGEYRYVSYESLLDHRIRESILRDTFKFLGLKVNRKVIRSQFEAQRFLELHPTTCKSRLKDWKTNKQNLMKSTRKACRNLDLILEANKQQKHQATTSPSSFLRLFF